MVTPLARRERGAGAIDKSILARMEPTGECVIITSQLANIQANPDDSL